MGLHLAIGNAIVNNPKRVSGAEFRFLRKEQELSQRTLADIMGTTEQTLARWEKSEITVPKMADHLIRHLFQQYHHQNGQMKAMVERLNTLEEKIHGKVNLTRQNGSWTETSQNLVAA